MADEDYGAQIAGLRVEIKAIDRRMLKVEKWCEEDSPEFHRQMQDFVISYKAVEAEREKVAKQRHQENSERLDQNSLRLEQIRSHNEWWNLGIAFLGLICAICMVYLAIKAANHAQVDPANLFHSETPQVAQMQQSAHW